MDRDWDNVDAVKPRVGIRGREVYARGEGRILLKDIRRTPKYFFTGHSLLAQSPYAGTPEEHSYKLIHTKQGKVGTFRRHIVGKDSLPAASSLSIMLMQGICRAQQGRYGDLT
jgi:hypothetical protein